MLSRKLISDSRVLLSSVRLINSGITKETKEELPDYNTSINIHEHKLKRPDRPPGSARWKGLEGLKERTRESLIPDTLKEMDESEEFKITAANLKRLGQAKLTKEERLKRQRALDKLGIPSFAEFMKMKREEKNIKVSDNVLRKRPIEILQLNIGLYCNQACNHCHVESSPRRHEMMDRQTAEKCLEVLKNSPSITTVDITGGAPELCSEFRYLAAGSRALDREVIVRSNLTSLLEPGQEDTAEFFADQGLHVIASLPSYSAKNVNIQRGKGVFDRSIHALLMLNDLGFGKEGTGLKLDLVYNPLGAFLPPAQDALELKYKEELMTVFGIEFNQLFTMTNMPIKRFADFLHRRNELHDYMELLIRNYNLKTVDNLMCLNLLSVNWDGKIFDCDFNQQLDIGMADSDTKGPAHRSILDISSVAELEGNKITVDNHCYGCTAGMGSS